MNNTELGKLNNNRWQDGVKIIEKLWHPEGKFELNGDELVLETGDNAENQRFIYDLSDTNFWFHFWYQSTRGGHYIFRKNAKEN